MTEINWAEIENGIRIILGLQVFLIGLIHFFNKAKPNIPLALLCVFVSLFYFWKWLMPIFNSTLISRIFLLLNRELFIPPLLYLILVQTQRNLFFKDYVKHLSAPFVFVTLCQIVIISNYDDIPLQLVANSVSMFPCLFMIVIYFFVGLKKLKELKIQLIPRAFKKYKLFFYVINFNYLNMFIQGILAYFIQYRILLTYYGDKPAGIVYTNTEYTWVNVLGWFFNGPFEFYNHFISIPLVYLTPVFVIVFGITELPYFKSFFLPKEVKHDEKVIHSGVLLIDKLKHFFESEKPFKNPDFSIDLCLQELNHTKKELQETLKIHKKTTFKEFVDKHRIEEFKKLALDKKYNIYDTVTLANMAGFKSKASFYRLFKQHEGCTPKEYLNTAKNN